MDLLQQIYNFTVAELTFVLTELSEKYDIKFLSKNTRKWDMIQLLVNQYHNPHLTTRIEYLRSSILKFVYFFNPRLHSLFQFSSEFTEQIILNQFHQASHYPGGVVADSLTLSFYTNKRLLEKGWKVFLFIGKYPAVKVFQNGKHIDIDIAVPSINWIRLNNSDITDIVKNATGPVQLNVESQNDSIVPSNIVKVRNQIEISFPELKETFIRGFLISIQLVKLNSPQLETKVSEEESMIDWSLPK
ncbi:hypothetical protein HDV02_003995, partial [Globomyces sp. JEL0801]